MKRKFTPDLLVLAKWFIINQRLLYALFFLMISFKLEMHASSSDRLSIYSEITVKGSVTNVSGEPLTGVNVLIKGSNRRVTTDFKGNFSLENVEETSVLVISFIGYQTQEVEVNGRQSIDVVLIEDLQTLEEVVVVGYGTQRRKDLTGAVVSVASDVVETRAVLSIADALVGKVSGVNVTSLDGEPGSRQRINIRGATSINADNEPLYIIDGFPSEVNFVNPAEILTIDILKDAASTAIYGSRGANGVIVITTKNGIKGKPKMDFYALGGIQAASKRLKLLNAYDFAKKNDLYGFFFVHADDFSIDQYDPQAYTFFQDNEDNYYLVNNENQYRDPRYYESGATNTDWQDAMFRTAKFNDYRLNVSGGEERYKYSLILGYKDQEGILLNTGHQEYTGRINLEYDLTDRIKVNLNSSLGLDNRKGYADAADGTNGILYYTLLQPPVKPVDFTRDFVLEGESAIGQTINPVLMARTIGNDRPGYNSLSNIALNAHLAKGLNLQLTGGYHYADLKINQYFPSDVSRGATVGGRSIRAEENTKVLNNENLLTYDPELAISHQLQIMVGNSLARSTRNWLLTENTNFTREGLGYWGHGYGLTPLIPNSMFIENTLASFFSRVNYIFKDKFLFKATIRADGSSRFARNNKWGYFPSAALGYRISEEPFLKNLNLLDDLKLRASWGITGKQAIGSYQSLASIGVTTFSIDGESATLSSFPQRLESPNLKWETTEELDLGLELSIFRQALTLTFDWYKRTTRDLLYQEPIPVYTGYAIGLRNVGVIENNGYELALRLKPVDNINFSWNLDFNMAQVKTTVVEFGQKGIATLNVGGVGGSVHGLLQEGRRVGNWFGYQTDGIWQSYEEIQQARNAGLIAPSIKVLPGYRKIVDQNGDGVITAEDRTIIGNGQPDWVGGFTNHLRYKRFSLSFMFNYSIGQDIYNYTRYHLEEGINFDNQLAIDRWTPTLYNWDPFTQSRGNLYISGSANNATPIAMFGKPQDNTFLDAYVENGSYLRLADISFTYDLPVNWLSKMKIGNASVFVSGRNLMIFTNYKGFDPDVNNSRDIAGYLLPGLDNFAYPKSRMITAGIKVTL